MNRSHRIVFGISVLALAALPIVGEALLLTRPGQTEAPGPDRVPASERTTFISPGSPSSDQFSRVFSRRLPPSRTADLMLEMKIEVDGKPSRQAEEQAILERYKEVSAYEEAAKKALDQQIDYVKKSKQQHDALARKYLSQPDADTKEKLEFSQRRLKTAEDIVKSYEKQIAAYPETVKKKIVPVSGEGWTSITDEAQAARAACASGQKPVRMSYQNPELRHRVIAMYYYWGYPVGPGIRQYDDGKSRDVLGCLEDGRLAKLAEFDAGSRDKNPKPLRTMEVKRDSLGRIEEKIVNDGQRRIVESRSYDGDKVREVRTRTLSLDASGKAMAMTEECISPDMNDRIETYKKISNADWLANYMASAPIQIAKETPGKESLSALRARDEKLIDAHNEKMAREKLRDAQRELERYRNNPTKKEAFLNMFGFGSSIESKRASDIANARAELEEAAQVTRRYIGESLAWRPASAEKAKLASCPRGQEAATLKVTPQGVPDQVHHLESYYADLLMGSDLPDQTGSLLACVDAKGYLTKIHELGVNVGSGIMRTIELKRDSQGRIVERDIIDDGRRYEISQMRDGDRVKLEKTAVYAFDDKNPNERKSLGACMSYPQGRSIPMDAAPGKTQASGSAVHVQ